VRVYHQGCRGYCPDYSLETDAQGNVKYEGNRSVDLMGKYQKNISTATVAQIWEAVQAANFFELEDEYGTEVADLPEVHTTVIANGVKKRIRNVRNGPPELKAMEEKIESLIGMDGLEKAE